MFWTKCNRASAKSIQKGVFVSCSAGNSGPSISSVANAAPWIITVAAIYIDRRFPTLVKLGNGETYVGSSLFSEKANTKQFPLLYGDKAGIKGAELCTKGTLSPDLAKGKIVVCDQGITGQAEKGEKVKMVGGVGELFADAHVLPATSLGALALR